MWRGFWVRKSLREALYRYQLSLAQGMASALLATAFTSAVAAVTVTRVRAAIRIQAVARGYLTRAGYYRMLQLHAHARAIQRLWTSYRMYVRRRSCVPWLARLREWRQVQPCVLLSTLVHRVWGRLGQAG